MRSSYLTPDSCGVRGRFWPSLDNFSLFLPEPLPTPPLLADVAADTQAQDEHHEDGTETPRAKQGEDSHQIWAGSGPGYNRLGFRGG